MISDREQFLDSQNKLAIAYNNLAVSCQNQGHFQQALINFQKALQVASNLPKLDLAKLYVNIATLLATQNRFEEALSNLKVALEIEPNYPEANNQQSRIIYEIWNQSKGYQFTQDWFSRNIPIWKEYLAVFIEQPGINFLEIGSWEGRSTCWLLDHILTHPSAKITCIDTFTGSLEHQNWFDETYIKSVEERFDFNISLTGAASKVTKVVGNSQEILRSLPFNSYDIVYIDGSHLASDVLEDAVLSWRLCNIGGIIIFDDYDFLFPQNPSQNTNIGIEAFLTAFQSKIKIIHKSHQVLVQKIAD